MKILHQNINIRATAVKDISHATKTFEYIDSDFKSWSLDKESPRKPCAKLAVLEMDKDGIFEQIFDSINKDKDLMCLTQAQIVRFCEDHRDKLRKNGYATFFLFKVGTEFFVARVYLNSDGGLEVNVNRFSRGSVWDAEYRHRIVVPQLALKYLDSATQTLSPSDTLAPSATEAEVRDEDLYSRVTELEQKVEKLIKGITIVIS